MTRFLYYNYNKVKQLHQTAIAYIKLNKPGSTILVFNLLIYFYQLKQYARIRKYDSLYKFKL